MMINIIKKFDSGVVKVGDIFYCVNSLSENDEKNSWNYMNLWNFEVDERIRKIKVPIIKDYEIHDNVNSIRDNSVHDIYRQEIYNAPSRSKYNYDMDYYNNKVNIISQEKLDLLAVGSVSLYIGAVAIELKDGSVKYIPLTTEGAEITHYHDLSKAFPLERGR